MCTAVRPNTVYDIDFAEIVRPADTVIWTQGASEPTTLVEQLLAQRHHIGRFNIFLGTSYSGLVRPEHSDMVSFAGTGAVGHNRAMCKVGALQVIPCHLSDLPRLLSDGRIRADVVFMQLSEDEAGELSVGAVNGYVQAALKRARVVIGEINECAPWTHARERVDRKQFDMLVRTSRPLIEVQIKEGNESDRSIAQNIAQFVSDEAVLQVGIGTIPSAVLAALRDRRDLGLHTGIIGDGVVELIERGVLTNAKKPIDPGRSVTGGLVGTKRIYDFAHRNTEILVEPVTYTHNPAVLSRFDRFVAINSAIEVDVTGQVGAEIAGRQYVGTVGGQGDFVRAALSAANGRSIIGLPARTERGTPRIVAQIKSGIVTTPRADADVIVTEFGAAELRGQPIGERVRRMIAIAHPDDREALARDARTTTVGL
jgi:acyl-CoA hydrolase